MATAKSKEKPAKAEAPAVDHAALVSAVADGIFDGVVAKSSHTRLEVGGKQVVYAEKRRGGISIIIPTKLLGGEFSDVVTQQEWHGGRSLLAVADTKASVAQARRVLKVVVKGFAQAQKDAEASKAATAEARKQRAKDARAADKAAKAEAAAA